jgi:hypothetical protein
MDKRDIEQFLRGLKRSVVPFGFVAVIAWALVNYPPLAAVVLGGLVIVMLLAAVYMIGED